MILCEWLQSSFPEKRGKTILVGREVQKGEFIMISRPLFLQRLSSWRQFCVSVLSILMSIVILAMCFVKLAVPVIHAANTSNAPDTSVGWSTYLFSNGRQSFNKNETILNPKTVSHMKMDWMQTAKGPVASEPIFANGLVYWGSWDGLEHASDPSTGNDVWSTNLGQTTSCLKLSPIGVESTAAIVTVPIHGIETAVDFVGGGDAQLYALNANTGAILWQTPLGSSSDYFIYDSPAFFAGSVYIGVSSDNDCPLVQGKMFQIDASTGAIQHTFVTVPDGCVGGGVWGSPAIDSTTHVVYFATGNSILSQCSQNTPYAQAVVALRTKDLSLVGSWQVPPSERGNDSDFGSTPTFFTTTIGGTTHRMLGIINKDSDYYAFDRSNISAGPLWQVKLALGGQSPEKGLGSISSSAANETRLFVATGNATINGKSCGGTINALDQASGTILWRDCLKYPVLAPVINVPKLVVVGSGPMMHVFDASTGNALFTYQDTNSNALFWGAATIYNGVLYDGNLDGNLYAFGL